MTDVPCICTPSTDLSAKMWDAALAAYFGTNKDYGSLKAIALQYAIEAGVPVEEIKDPTDNT